MGGWGAGRGELRIRVRSMVKAEAAGAVRLLRRRGFEAVRLADGYPEWRDAGLPVEHARRPAAQEQRA